MIKLGGEKVKKNRPYIGIVGNLHFQETGTFAGSDRLYVNNDYPQAVQMAGGIPFVLPFLTDYKLVKEQIENLNGIIISGGYDVNPLLYGQEPTEKQGYSCEERDSYDVMVINTAIQMNKPIFAICRGIQILNIVLGGTIYEDISYKEGCRIKHSQKARTHVATHTVELQKGSRLYSLLGESVLTNSFHHQAVKDVAPGFKIVGKSKDGVIEAMERDIGFVVGVQWHPEMMARKGDKKMLSLFEAFVGACHL